jgi:hypothetical protein
MSEKRIYLPLSHFSRDAVKAAIENNDIDILIFVSLSAATYDPDWKYAQDLCIRLSNHPNKTVRGNAILGLAYVARIHEKLEKFLVKPIW